MAPQPLFVYSCSKLFNLEALKSFKLPDFEDFNVNENRPDENNERQGGANVPTDRQPSKLPIIGDAKEYFRVDQSTYSSSNPTDTGNDDTDSEKTMSDTDSEIKIIPDTGIDNTDSERIVTDTESDDSDSERSITDDEYRVSEEDYQLMLIQHMKKRQKMAAASARNTRRIEPCTVSQVGSSTQLLEMGNGIVFKIPPTYDILAQSMNLPTLSDVRIDGGLDFRCLNAMLAAERRATNRNAGCSIMYPSLQDSLNRALRASNSAPFNLKVVDSDNVEATMMQAFESDHVEAPAMPVTQSPVVPERPAMYPSLQDSLNRALRASNSAPFNLKVVDSDNVEAAMMQAFESDHVEAPAMPVTQSPVVPERPAMYPSLQDSLNRALRASNSAPLNLKVVDSDNVEATMMQAFESDHVEAPTMPVTQSPIVPERPAIPETDQLQHLSSGMKALNQVNFPIRSIEHQPPKRQQLMLQKVSPIENADMEIRSFWRKVVRKDISKHHRHYMWLHRKNQSTAKRLAEGCQKEVKNRSTRSLRLMKSAATRTKKLAKDMLIFYKRFDKEQVENRKKQEKEEAEALKREEAAMEEKRQQRGLNFLLAKSKMYAHFMQPNQGDEASTSNANLTEGEDREDAAMKEKALKTALDAASRQKEIINQFDDECERLRESRGSSSNMDLVNPSSMPCTSSVQTPNMLHATLTGYQLKGLQWLVNCYEMSVNGILADEMGLGKTVQAISFLAHLAEEKNKWGPFLVVAPASVAPNWADEMAKFCPDLITFPYWGSERTVLKKRINPKKLYRKDSNFHVLITNYQIVVKDEQYLKRVKWQYMILDEAQAIKSSNSERWKTLMSFECRNRVLLTGTPIQNNMAELWALLHFIMPTLFNCQEQFKEWFSKDIESHAEHGSLLNEHNLKKLHDVLKPFMLRRLKKDVIGEMPGKTELTINCKLSSRQQTFYHAIRNKVSIAELLDSNRLMNIVMQLRKVCNHPDLFERIEAHTTMYFGHIQSSLLPPPCGKLADIYYAGRHSPISYKIPKLVYRECTENLPVSSSGSPQCFQQKWLNNLLNVFSTENVHRSLFPVSENETESVVRSGTFGFSRMVDLSPTEVAFLAKSSQVEKWLFSLTIDQYPNEMEEGKVRAVTKMLMMPPRPADFSFLRSSPLGLSKALIVSLAYRFLRKARKYRPFHSFVPAVSAPPVDVVCSDRRFAYQRMEELHHPWMKRLLVGFARTSEFNGPAKPDKPHYLIQEINSQLAAQQPLLELTQRTLGTSPPLQSFGFAKMLTYSGKMQILDALLKRLRAENHRVLLFAQMTKMLDIIEDYMKYRKYKYLRLDGSSTVTNRHEMVKEFQTNTDIFVFLLSTRAGGVGINLTAADTVIFYESDWNPTQDKQAMDRSHRLGQTKEVTVYRLICKGTIEEKILQRASKKNTVQQLVMTGRQAKVDEIAAADVISLFTDDDTDSQLEQKIKDMGKDKLKKKTVRFVEDDVHIEEMEGDKGGEVGKVKTQRKKRKDDV
ncbi:hypothetical protein SUGI_0175460 [Cryptomeria japonica]|uniref:chromatin-remodeling ATPase INO80-like n=1 Tax=Cryptomeria japonica TaxID=3369 RepID=UPI002408EC93|nr:chromatin-remodeling ATPase INO80-like [Cryptomeria japonica]GLJ11725.1 hypothetical protein SUGI_0175460 [Cryptomeria japonica]